ncbi:streptomycin 6-kinase [Mariniluteicoccus endophyticus]
MTPFRRDDLPAELLARMGPRPAEGGPTGAAWLDTVPTLAGDLLDEWSLVWEGGFRSGHTSVVLPVARDDEPLVLKIGWPHRESRGEHLGLRAWDGNGIVHLVAADPGRGALLLERLDATRTLDDLWDEEACGIAGDLLARLHATAPPPNVPRLSRHVRRNHERLRTTRGVLPPRFLDRALALGRELTRDPACDSVLVHGDLHYWNVPGAEREPWLAIDPKPMAGHPGAEVLPLLRNRVDELGTGSELRYLVRRRLEVVSEAMGVDERDARLWTIVMTSIDALWAHEDGDRDGVTLAIALMKAMED